MLLAIHRASWPPLPPQSMLGPPVRPAGDISGRHIFEWHSVKGDNRPFDLFARRGLAPVLQDVQLGQTALLLLSTVHATDETD